MKRKWICYYGEKYKLFDDMNEGLVFYENKCEQGLPCLFMEL